MRIELNSRQSFIDVVSNSSIDHSDAIPIPAVVNAVKKMLVVKRPIR